MNRISIPARPTIPRLQRGAGMIETMIGILIGMIVILVIYNVFAVAEGYKRTTVGVGDAQVTGQFANFLIAREIASAGNGISSGMIELQTCNNDWRLKAIPVLITDGGNANTSDSLITFYSNSPRIVNPILFTLGNASGVPFEVQSPNGFQVNDWVIATDRTANCSITRVTGVAPLCCAGPPDPQGRVVVSHAPATGFAYPATSRLVNMGQISRTQFTVDAVKQQLYSQDVNPDPSLAVQPVVPLAQNITLLKVQYGIDTDNDLDVDCWTSADNSNICNAIDYSVGAIGSAATTGATIQTIKAARIAVIVRSDEPDSRDPALVGQTAWLFNCSANTNAACQGRMQVTDNVNILRDGYRHRIYETMVPLRNALWN